MILRAAVLALTATVLVAPAARASTTLVDQTDPTGDVNVLDGGGSKPTTAQRLSIDLQRFTVTRTADGARFTYQLKRVTGSRAYFQTVTADLGPGGSLFSMTANPQGKHATAFVGDDTVCLLDVSTSANTVRVDVPSTCLPEGKNVLRVTTYTQKPNGSGPGYSEDALRVKGRVSLR